MTITSHACLRFVQRVQGIDVDTLTPAQVAAVKEKIASIIAPYTSTVSSLDHMQLSIDGFWWVIKDQRVITVKSIIPTQLAQFNGGITKSGKKIKKRRSKKPMEDK